MKDIDKSVNIFLFLLLINKVYASVRLKEHDGPAIQQFISSDVQKID